MHKSQLSVNMKQQGSQHGQILMLQAQIEHYKTKIRIDEEKYNSLCQDFQILSEKFEALPNQQRQQETLTKQIESKVKKQYMQILAEKETAISELHEDNQLLRQDLQYYQRVQTEQNQNNSNDMYSRQQVDDIKQEFVEIINQLELQKQQMADQIEINRAIQLQRQSESQLLQQISQLSDEKQEMQTIIEQLSQNLDDALSQKQQLQSTLDQIQQTNQDQQQVICEQQKIINTYNKQQTQTSQIEHQKHESVQTQHYCFSNTLKDIIKDSISVLQQNSVVEQCYESITQKLSLKSITEKVQQLKTQLDMQSHDQDETVSNSQLINDNQKYKEAISQLETEISQLKQRIQETQQQYVIISSQFNQLFNEMQKQCSTCITAMTELDNNIQIGEQQQKTLQNDVAQLKLKYQMLQQETQYNIDIDTLIQYFKEELKATSEAFESDTQKTSKRSNYIVPDSVVSKLQSSKMLKDYENSLYQLQVVHHSLTQHSLKIEQQLFQLEQVRKLDKEAHQDEMRLLLEEADKNAYQLNNQIQKLLQTISEQDSAIKQVKLELQEKLVIQQEYIQNTFILEQQLGDQKFIADQKQQQCELQTLYVNQLTEQLKTSVQNVQEIQQQLNTANSLVEEQNHHIIQYKGLIERLQNKIEHLNKSSLTSQSIDSIKETTQQSSNILATATLQSTEQVPTQHDEHEMKQKLNCVDKSQNTEQYDHAFKQSSQKEYYSLITSHSIQNQKIIEMKQQIQNLEAQIEDIAFTTSNLINEYDVVDVQQKQEIPDSNLSQTKQQISINNKSPANSVFDDQIMEIVRQNQMIIESQLNGIAGQQNVIDDICSNECKNNEDKIRKINDNLEILRNILEKFTVQQLHNITSESIQDAQYMLIQKDKELQQLREQYNYVQIDYVQHQSLAKQLQQQNDQLMQDRTLYLTQIQSLNDQLLIAQFDQQSQVSLISSNKGDMGSNEVKLKLLHDQGENLKNMKQRLMFLKSLKESTMQIQHITLDQHVSSGKDAIAFEISQLYQKIKQIPQYFQFLGDYARQIQRINSDLFENILQILDKYQNMQNLNICLVNSFLLIRQQFECIKPVLTSSGMNSSVQHHISPKIQNSLLLLSQQWSQINGQGNENQQIAVGVSDLSQSKIQDCIQINQQLSQRIMDIQLQNSQLAQSNQQLLQEQQQQAFRAELVQNNYHRQLLELTNQVQTLQNQIQHMNPVDESDSKAISVK